MTTFTGTNGIDTADATVPSLTGFTGGSLAELTDGTGDIFICLDGNDIVHAGDGNDTINGGVGADTLDGGGGSDTYDFNSGDVVSGEVISDSGGGGIDTIRILSSVFFADVTIAGIEALTFTGDQAALFIADQLPSNLAVTGDDGSNQTIHLTTSNDFSAAGWTFASWETSGFNDFLVIVASASAQTLIGSSQSDIFSGGGGADTLDGRGGSDTYQFGGENLSGLTLNDTGPSGTDTLAAGSATTTDFSVASTIAGIEALSFSSSSSAIFNASQFSGGGIAINLAATGHDGFTQTITINNASNFSAAAWTFSTWETTDVITITGTSSADTITGSSQNDTIDGLAGNDVLQGGAGDDILDGGNDNDTASYASATNAVTATLVDVGDGSATGTDIGTDTLSNIENLIGGAGADSLTGNSQANTLTGGAGADHLDGGDGGDTYVFGSGDVVTGEQITDTGTGDTDTIKLTGALTDVDFKLATVSGIEALTFTDNQTAQFNQDQLPANLVVTGPNGSSQQINVSTASNFTAAAWTFALWDDANDFIVINDTSDAHSITGSSQSDTIAGGGGADALDGRGGSDIYQFAGEDLTGVIINDTGAIGTDTLLVQGGTADFSVATVADIEALAFTGAFTATFNAAQLPASFVVTGVNGSTQTIAINNASSFSAAAWTFTPWEATDVITITGTGVGDTITGSNQIDSIDGGNGNDTLRGGAGSDALDGGEGSDIYDYGASEVIGGETINDSGSAGTDTIRLLGDVNFTPATITNIEALAFTGAQEAQFNSFPLPANLAVTGANGTTQQLVVHNASGFSAAAWTFTSWEATDVLTFNGTGAGQTITGSSQRDTINASDGNDTLRGGLGADLLDGGNDNDIFVIAGSEGIGDILDGGAGTDTLQVTGGGAATLSAFNAAASLTEQWQGNNQGLFGTAAANTFNFSGLTSKTGLPFVDGGGGNDNITGSNFADTLRGGTGIDTLKGQAGIDTLIGGALRDTLTGGTGRDIFDFNFTSESKKGGANRDVITDFTRGSNSVGDDIDLRTIDAKTGAGNNAFHFIGSKAFSKAKGELHTVKSGSSVIVQGDVNGDGNADLEILVLHKTAMVAGDFLL